MAAEISISSSISATKGGTSIPTKGGSFTRDWAGKDYDSGKLVATTAATNAEGLAIPMLSTIGTPGMLWVKNLDATNFITVGPRSSATYVPFVKIPPGECYPFPLAVAAGAAYIQADTAACDYEYLVLEV